MSFKTGHIYHFKPCGVSAPVKSKFALCVSGSNSLFCLINSVGSDGNRVPPPPFEYQIRKGFVQYLDTYQIQSINSYNVLSHKSYMDVSKIHCIQDCHYDVCKDCGIIVPNAWISAKGLAKTKLPEKYASIISDEKIVN